MRSIPATANLIGKFEAAPGHSRHSRHPGASGSPQERTFGRCLRLCSSAGGDGGRKAPEASAPPTTANKEKSPGSEPGARLRFVVTRNGNGDRLLHNVHFLDNQRSVT